MSAITAHRTTSGRTDYATPWWFVRAVCERFGIDAFALDICATGPTSKGLDYLGPDHALRGHRDAHRHYWVRWRNTCAWMNPPYGRGIDRWVHLAARVASEGLHVVALLPGNAWDASWWGRYVLGQHVATAHEIHPILGRIHFELDGVPQTSPANGNVIVVWRPGRPPAAPVLREPLSAKAPQP